MFSSARIANQILFVGDKQVDTDVACMTVTSSGDLMYIKHTPLRVIKVDPETLAPAWTTDLGVGNSGAFSSVDITEMKKDLVLVLINIFWDQQCKYSPGTLRALVSSAGVIEESLFTEFPPYHVASIATCFPHDGCRQIARHLHEDKKNWVHVVSHWDVICSTMSSRTGVKHKYRLHQTEVHRSKKVNMFLSDAIPDWRERVKVEELLFKEQKEEVCVASENHSAYALREGKLSMTEKVRGTVLWSKEMNMEILDLTFWDNGTKLMVTLATKDTGLRGSYHVVIKHLLVADGSDL